MSSESVRNRLHVKIMNFTSSACIILLIAISFNFSLSLALLGIVSEEFGERLCWEIPKNFSACPNVEFDRWRILELGSYPNITSPRIIIKADEGSSFNARFNNATFIQNARVMLVMGEKTEIDIELTNISTSYKIQCWSFGSFSKLSSNIIMSYDTTWEIARSVRRIPILSTSFGEVAEQELQSGHFTCRSVEQRNFAETFRIFTKLATQSDGQESSPFVPVPRSTVQSDLTGNGFIVPCRTNYRMENPPDLLWKKHSKDSGTLLTADEMRGFRWDPRVGFQFNSSDRMWEIRILVCRSGSFEKTFLPTSALFINSMIVRAENDKIGCDPRPKNHSSSLLASNLTNQKAYHHKCTSYIECELLLESSTLLNVNRDRNNKITLKNSTLDYTKKSGIFSCFAEHDYKGTLVPSLSSRMFFVGLDSNVYLLPGSYPNTSVIQISQVHGPFYKYHTELSHKFICTTIKFIKAGAVYFMLRYKNQTEQFVKRDPSKSSVEPSEDEFKVSLNPNITHAICLCLTQDGRVVSAEIPLQIIDAFELIVNNSTPRTRIFKVGELSASLTLTCPITAVKPPTYRWTLDKKNSDLVGGTNTQNLTFRQSSEGMAGSYTCEARNEYYNESFEFQVNVQPQDISSALSGTTKVWIATGAVLCCILLVVILTFAIKYFKTKRQIRKLTPEEAFEFLNGLPDLDEASHAQGPELALHLPFTKCIEPNFLNVARDSVLGKGQYGIVYRGSLHTDAVAVKTFKRAVTYDEFRAGLVEVKLMNFVGEHPNIVRFIGADVTNIENRDILIVMELSPLGSLEKHLKILNPANQTNYISTATPQYENVDERLTLVKLFSFCEQIAFSMEYLESKKVIHGDLAARNVLVFNHDVVKVTDFGYSRQLLENNMYKPKKTRALPWRWGSIELLRQMEFSTESDIWAFGVTVWEIFTFGNVPFASEKWNEQFMLALENGLRLKKPSGFSNSQYSTVKECWNVDKSARPRFGSLKAFFSTESKRLDSETFL